MLYLSLHPHTLHFKRPARTSRGDLTARQLWLVRVWDAKEPKVIGWGECGPVPGLSIDTRYEIRDTKYEVAAETIAEAFRELQIDTQCNPALAFGVEMALLDLWAGGIRQLFDTAFVRGEAGLCTHGLIWMDEPNGILEQVDKKVATGHTVIKMKVGAIPFAQELALLREVRSRYPKIELRLDANGAFAQEEALASLEQLASLHIAFLEQPIRAGQWQAMAEICRQSPIPIGLDEELIGVENPHALIEAIGPHHLILKPTLLGGFAACERWMKLCDEIGAQWWINSLLESNIGLNAICQWTSAQDDYRIHGLGTGQLFVDNIESPLRLRNDQLWYDPTQGWSLPIDG